ncbi:MAG: hypothetical protein KF887_00365 [Paracoccaceae bacterium]|nr:MAG: hypothetical protein KF887_00365 [Paracoccaceae bacterium]
MTIAAACRPAFPSAFRASPEFCATLTAANAAPRRPSGAARRTDRVTRDEIAALFAADLYAAV